jgi:membrane fusion protein (multidrug efflux system)
MRSVWLGLVLVVAACGGGEGGDPGGEEKKDDAPKESVTVVETADVARGDVVDALVASATLEAAASADLTPATSGIVVRVTHDVGDHVDKGELLALIDNKPIDAGVSRARTQVAQLEARLTELKTLAEQGAVSAREVEDIEWQLRTAKDSLRETTATADQSRLLAPFSGVLAMRDIRVGEAAGAGKRAFQVVDLSSLRVVASLPERDVARVHLGQPAKLTAAYDDKLSAMAKVTRLSPVIDPATGTFQVTLTLDPGETLLRPGQYVSVALEVDRRAEVLVVSREAILYDNGRPVVFRVKDAPPEEPKASEDEEKPEEEGWMAKLSAMFAGEPEPEEPKEEAKPEDTGPRLVAERVAVKLGLVDAKTAEIIEGLGEGDKIVVVGQANLKDGARVRPPKPAEPAAAVPAAPTAAVPGDAPAGG